ncbi:TetR/AcrR family transcriptional regulator [Allokutzneria multivorans]|uniref:TetR/AcrR family transcriptional regulator n=1 Tax=Allokutzneria multivorans TaxID=1142134 RepID=A0ABP7RN52_9PSEU
MPTPFSAADRTRITEILLRTGENLFTTQGLRKTSLDDLVKPANIAKSSFYAFFESKEALYLELMLRQAPQVQKQLLDEVLTKAPDLRTAIKDFLRATLRVLDDNPLYRRLVTHPEELQAVSRRIDPERAAEVREQVNLPLGEFFRRAARSSKLIDISPEAVIGLMQAVLLLPLHRDEFAEDVYPVVLDQLIEFVANGLTTAPVRALVTEMSPIYV